jgi:hypothetical protein
LIGRFGADQALPEGAVTVVSQDSTTVTVNIKQLWSNPGEDVVWIVPYYFIDDATPYQCARNRAFPYLDTLEVTINCFDNEAELAVIVNDNSISSGNTLTLPLDCVAEEDDIPTQIVAYKFLIPCVLTCDLSGAPTNGPTITASPSSSFAPSATPSVSSAPSPTPMPVPLTPTASPAPTKTPAPFSSAPSTTPSPSTSQTPSTTPSTSLAPSACLDKTRPKLLNQFGTNTALPVGAVTIVSQDRTDVTFRVAQLWSNATNNLVWMAAYYQAAANNATFLCEKERDVTFESELDFTAPCFQGETTIAVIVNDESFVDSTDLDLPRDCVSDVDDITGKMTSYLFTLPCTAPLQPC